MEFLSPQFLWLSLLAVLPVLLYLFRRKSKTVRVSTLVFFKSLAREHQESAWLRRLKRLLSLLLTLLVLMGCVFALGRLVVSPGREDAQSVVILLDRSASMGALDAAGESRLEAARRILRGRLATLPEAVPVSLVAYDARPEVVQPKTTNRRALLRALDEIVVRPTEDDPAAALSAGIQIARLETPAAIWRVTDTPAAVEPGDTQPREGDPESEDVVDAESEAEAGAVDPVRPGEESDSGVAAGRPPADGSGPDLALTLPPGVREDWIDVSLGKSVNAGITAFQVRPLPLQHAKYEAYVQVALSEGAADRPVEAEVEVRIGEGIPLPRRIDLEPGSRQGLILPIEGADGELLEVRVSVEGDCLASDDRVFTRLPQSRPVVVRWITRDPDPFTQLALNAIAVEGELDVWRGAPESWPGDDRPDVVIFDGWLPDEWPGDVPVIVINPPGSAGPVRAVPIEGGGVPHETVRVTNAEHPVLFRVSSGRVALTQTAVLDTAGSLEPLWFAGTEPILEAGESGGQRLVVMAFSPMRSEQLPLMASYPLLVGNAVFWCAEQSAAASRPLDASTGSIIEAGGNVLTWTEWSDGRLRETSQAVDGPLVELDRIGLWETADGRSGSSMLLSSRETVLRSPPDGAAGTAASGGDATAADESTGAGVARPRLTGEWTRWFLAMVLVVLVVESWLFHRHAVY